MKLKLRRSKQRGVVLITVMVILTVAIVIAARISEDQQIALRLTSHLITRDQAREYVKGAEALAKISLAEDWKADKKEDKFVDHESEAWGMVQSFPVDGGLIEGRLIDVQGLFNINELVKNTQAQLVFKDLLSLLKIPSNTELSPQDMLEAMIDWMDEDQDQIGILQSEDYYYLGKENPYRTAGQPLAHLSELNLIRGWTREDIKKIRPYVRLLSVGTPVNINAASKMLTAAFSQNRSDEIFANRPAEGYTKEDLGALSKSSKPRLAYTNRSQFFELRTQVELGDERVRVRTLLFRPLEVSMEAPIQVIGRDAANLFLLM